MYIEKDAALTRRFQTVLVTEPSVEDTISILRGIKDKCVVLTVAVAGHCRRLPNSQRISAVIFFCWRLFF